MGTRSQRTGARVLNRVVEAVSRPARAAVEMEISERRRTLILSNRVAKTFQPLVDASEHFFGQLRLELLVSFGPLAPSRLGPPLKPFHRRRDMDVERERIFTLALPSGRR